MKKTTTPTVDAIEQIAITGNITPRSWFLAIRRNEKAQLLAINILSDVLYWYRATYSYDEESGELVSITKKFRSDKLQKSYGAWALQFGQSKQQVKDACDLLVEMELITREFRTVRTESSVLPNVMFVEPIPESIAHITYKVGGVSPQKPPPPMVKKLGDVGVKSGGTNTKITTESTAKNSTENSTAAGARQHSQNALTAAPAESLTKAQIILQHLGVDLPNAATEFAIALEWAYWMKFYAIPKSDISNPPAFIAKRLRENPNCHPPERLHYLSAMQAKPHAFAHLFASASETNEDDSVPQMELEF